MLMFAKFKKRKYHTSTFMYWHYQTVSNIVIQIGVCITYVTVYFHMFSHQYNYVKRLEICYSLLDIHLKQPFPRFYGGPNPASLSKVPTYENPLIRAIDSETQLGRQQHINALLAFPHRTKTTESFFD